jgi:hypothetical protein
MLLQQINTATNETATNYYNKQKLSDLGTAFYFKISDKNPKKSRAFLNDSSPRSTLQYSNVLNFASNVPSSQVCRAVFLAKVND